MWMNLKNHQSISVLNGLLQPNRTKDKEMRAENRKPSVTIVYILIFVLNEMINYCDEYFKNL
jgi:hypothetical protein